MAVKRIDERKRLSTLSFNVTGNQAQTDAFQEIAGPHMYRLESVFLGQGGFYRRRGDDNSMVIDRQLDLEGNPSFDKSCRWLNPLALIATDYGGQLGDLLDVRNSLFVTGVIGKDIEKNPRDGLCSTVLLGKSGTGAVRITFDPRVPWLPIESRFKISRNGTKWRPGMSLDVLEKWETYNVTTCRWHEVSGHFVPLTVKFDYSSNATGARAVTEYLFSDWRFGNEVNLDLLDREKFCKLETMNRPDFDRVESRFIELRNKLSAR